MSTYIDVPIVTDPDTLAQEAFDYVQAKIAGWVPNDANLETIIIEAISRVTAEARDVASAVPTDVFRAYGKLVGVEQQIAKKASATSTWTMINNAGYTIPAGTQIGVRVSGDLSIPFETLVDTVIAPGSTTATGVVIQAVEAGADASGLPITSVLDILDTLDFVTGVVLTSDTAGGQDEETIETYLARLVTRLQLLSPRPILPRDFAVLALDITGVARSVAIDGYDPDHNLLTPNQSSLETDTTGWVADVNCTISRVTTQHSDGAAALQLSSVASGTMSAKTTPVTQYAVTPGQQVAAIAEFKSAASVRACRVKLAFYTSGSVLISTVTGANFNDSTTAFVQANVIGIAPATAAYVIIIGEVQATGGALEVHWMDKIALRHSTSLSWKIGGSPEFNNERMITVISVDSAGEPVSTPIKNQVQTYLDSLRELTFVVNVGDPVYTTIDVTFAAKVKPGYDATTTELAAEQAVTDYLSPKNWGLPGSQNPGDSVVASWTDTPVVRYLELSQVINNIGGIDYITSLTFRVAGGTMDVLDITLAGVAALPRPGAIAGTVT